MTHLDHELANLKASVLDMWKLNIMQFEKCKDAFVNFDKELALEIISRERRVNAYELKIDRDCEDIFALFNPVAVDLRFVLAVLKINSNLERIGDMAEGISRLINDATQPFDKELVEKTHLIEMFDTAISMLKNLSVAFVSEDTTLTRSVFQQDYTLDKHNTAAPDVIAAYIPTHLEHTIESLHILSTIRKLERAGDQAKNIAEEIIFYVEAKVLKHTSRKDKNKE